MKQRNLWLMSGIPGSGKSTWIQQKIKENGGVWISRDKIRFLLLKDGEDYFSHENEVFDIFVKEIQKSIEDINVNDIYVDATHLNTNSRAMLLGKIKLHEDINLNCIVFDVPLEIAIERNEKRTGRAVVPQSVIRRMYFSKNAPTQEEGFVSVLSIDEHGNERKVW